MARIETVAGVTVTGLTASLNDTTTAVDTATAVAPFTGVTLVTVGPVVSGVALAPACMFVRELQLGLLARPFDVDVRAGGYWLTSLKSKPLTPAMTLFRDWIVAEAAAAAQAE